MHLRHKVFDDKPGENYVRPSGTFGSMYQRMECRTHLTDAFDRGPWHVSEVSRGIDRNSNYEQGSLSSKSA